ncbi:Protein SOGA1 [Manis javanica]|nr:Protein SOGA1 [Manis javanica]
MSATHPTRLEARTKESNVRESRGSSESRRGAMKASGVDQHAACAVGGGGTGMKTAPKMICPPSYYSLLYMSPPLASYGDRNRVTGHSLPQLQVSRVDQRAERARVRRVTCTGLRWTWVAWR